MDVTQQRLVVVPISISAAKAYIARWHRHSAVPQGGLFAVACAKQGDVEPCGVALVGRPVARMLNDGTTCEVTRLATDGTRNACSMLYGACVRAARALGYRRCLTYTLQSESGASLRAVGALPVARVKGRSWDTPSRRRSDKGAAQWDLFGEREP